MASSAGPADADSQQPIATDDADQLELFDSYLGMDDVQDGHDPGQDHAALQVDLPTSLGPLIVATEPAIAGFNAELARRSHAEVPVAVSSLVGLSFFQWPRPGQQTEHSLQELEASYPNIAVLARRALEGSFPLRVHLHVLVLETTLKSVDLYIRPLIAGLGTDHQPASEPRPLLTVAFIAALGRYAFVAPSDENLAATKAAPLTRDRYRFRKCEGCGRFRYTANPTTDHFFCELSDRNAHFEQSCSDPAFTALYVDHLTDDIGSLDRAAELWTPSGKLISVGGLFALHAVFRRQFPPNAATALGLAGENLDDILEKHNNFAKLRTEPDVKAWCKHSGAVHQRALEILGSEGWRQSDRLGLAAGFELRNQLFDCNTASLVTATARDAVLSAWLEFEAGAPASLVEQTRRELDLWTREIASRGSSREVMRFEQLFVLQSNIKIAWIGPVGVGKSTLLDALLETSAPDVRVYSKSNLLQRTPATAMDEAGGTDSADAAAAGAAESAGIADSELRLCAPFRDLPHVPYTMDAIADALASEDRHHLGEAYGTGAHGEVSIVVVPPEQAEREAQISRRRDSARAETTATSDRAKATVQYVLPRALSGSSTTAVSVATHRSERWGLAIEFFSLTNFVKGLTECAPNKTRALLAPLHGLRAESRGDVLSFESIDSEDLVDRKADQLDQLVQELSRALADDAPTAALVHRARLLDGIAQCKLLGQVIVFDLETLDFEADRATVRRLLASIQGLSFDRERLHAALLPEDPQHAAALWGDPAALCTALMDPEIGRLWGQSIQPLIRRVHLFAPSEVLPPGGQFVDVPGSIDEDVFKARMRQLDLAEAAFAVGMFPLASINTVAGPMQALLSARVVADFIATLSDLLDSETPIEGLVTALADCLPPLMLTLKFDTSEVDESNAAESERLQAELRETFRSALLCRMLCGTLFGDAEADDIMRSASDLRRAATRVGKRELYDRAAAIADHVTAVERLVVRHIAVNAFTNELALVRAQEQPLAKLTHSLVWGRGGAWKPTDPTGVVEVIGQLQEFVLRELLRADGCLETRAKVLADIATQELAADQIGDADPRREADLLGHLPSQEQVDVLARQLVDEAAAELSRLHATARDILREFIADKAAKLDEGAGQFDGRVPSRARQPFADVEFGHGLLRLSNVRALRVVVVAAANLVESTAMALLREYLAPQLIASLQRELPVDFARDSTALAREMVAAFSKSSVVAGSKCGCAPTVAVLAVMKSVKAFDDPKIAGYAETHLAGYDESALAAELERLRNEGELGPVIAFFNDLLESWAQTLLDRMWRDEDIASLVAAVREGLAAKPAAKRGKARVRHGFLDGIYDRAQAQLPQLKEQQAKQRAKLIHDIKSHAASAQQTIDDYLALWREHAVIPRSAPSARMGSGRAVVAESYVFRAIGALGHGVSSRSQLLHDQRTLSDLAYELEPPLLEAMPQRSRASGVSADPRSAFFDGIDSVIQRRSQLGRGPSSGLPLSKAELETIFGLSELGALAGVSHPRLAASLTVLLESSPAGAESRLNALLSDATIAELCDRWETRVRLERCDSLPEALAAMLTIRRHGWNGLDRDDSEFSTRKEQVARAFKSLQERARAKPSAAETERASTAASTQDLIEFVATLVRRPIALLSLGDAPSSVFIARPLSLNNSSQSLQAPYVVLCVPAHASRHTRKRVIVVDDQPSFLVFCCDEAPGKRRMFSSRKRKRSDERSDDDDDDGGGGGEEHVHDRGQSPGDVAGGGSGNHGGGDGTAASGPASRPSKVQRTLEDESSVPRDSAGSAPMEIDSLEQQPQPAPPQRTPSTLSAIAGSAEVTSSLAGGESARPIVNRVSIEEIRKNWLPFGPWMEFHLMGTDVTLVNKKSLAAVSIPLRELRIRTFTSGAYRVSAAPHKPAAKRALNNSVAGDDRAHVSASLFVVADGISRSSHPAILSRSIADAACVVARHPTGNKYPHDLRRLEGRVLAVSDMLARARALLEVVIPDESARRPTSRPALVALARDIFRVIERTYELEQSLSELLCELSHFERELGRILAAGEQAMEQAGPLQSPLISSSVAVIGELIQNSDEVPARLLVTYFGDSRVLVLRRNSDGTFAQNEPATIELHHPPATPYQRRLVRRGTSHILDWSQDWSWNGQDRSVNPQQTSFLVRPGDIVIAGSDGVFERKPEFNRRSRLLETCELRGGHRNRDWLAGSVLDRLNARVRNTAAAAEEIRNLLWHEFVQPELDRQAADDVGRPFHLKCRDDATLLVVQVGIWAPESGALMMGKDTYKDSHTREFSFLDQVVQLPGTL